MQIYLDQFIFIYNFNLRSWWCMLFDTKVFLHSFVYCIVILSPFSYFPSTFRLELSDLRRNQVCLLDSAFKITLRVAVAFLFLTPKCKLFIHPCYQHPNSALPVKMNIRLDFMNYFVLDALLNRFFYLFIYYYICCLN